MSFNQSGPTVPTVLNTSNCFVFGNTASGNALSVQQLGAGNVATFRTTTGATALFVGANGNVGVGTTSPGYPLHVIGTGTTINLSNTAAQTVVNAQIGRINFGNGGSDASIASCVNVGGVNNNADLRFYTSLDFINQNLERMRIDRTGNVGIGTTTSAYALDTVGDINASSTLRIGGLTQPRLISSGTFTNAAFFDTVTFDLVNYNIAEIRMTVYFSTTNQRIMSSQLLDTGGTVFSGNETGWQMFYNTGGVAASGTGAYILNNTEIAGNSVGGFIVVIRLIGAMGISGGIRNHWEWTTTGCYSNTGASTTYGRAACYNPGGATINRMRFNLSGGTMTGKYSIINYST